MACSARPLRFTIPALRYMKEYGLTHEQLAYVAVAQRRWAAKNPRAIVPGSDHRGRRARLPDRGLPLPFARMLPGHRRRRSARHHVRRIAPAISRRPAVHVLGTGESSETPVISQMGRFHRVAGDAAGRTGCVSQRRESASATVGHLMIYDGLRRTCRSMAWRRLASCPRARLAPSLPTATRSQGGALPLNTNGGGLSYTHTGMYGMFRDPGRGPPGSRRSRRSSGGPGDQRRGWATAGCSQTSGVPRARARQPR